MIYKRLSLVQFIDEFRRMNRDQFSFEGYKVLFEHIEDMVACHIFEHPYVLDVIGVVVEYSEISKEELMDMYDMDMQQLEDHTTILEVDADTVIYAEF